MYLTDSNGTMKVYGNDSNYTCQFEKVNDSCSLGVFDRLVVMSKTDKNYALRYYDGDEYVNNILIFYPSSIYQYL